MPTFLSAKIGYGAEQAKKSNLTMRLPKLKPQITLYVGAISFAFLKDCFEDFYSLLILYSESIRS
jgi:hypothetical protein